MGYFSSGSEGLDYEEQWCRRCVHYGPENGPGCPVWLAHLLHNGDEVLELLIPRSLEGAGNDQCLMFIEDQARMEAWQARQSRWREMLGMVR